MHTQWLDWLLSLLLLLLFHRLFSRQCMETVQPQTCGYLFPSDPCHFVRTYEFITEDVVTASNPPRCQHAVETAIPSTLVAPPSWGDIYSILAFDAHHGLAVYIVHIVHKQCGHGKMPAEGFSV